MADFKQALDWLNEGKRVRRKNWGKPCYIKKGLESTLQDQYGERLEVDLKIVLTIDWELYEEKSKCVCVTEDQQMVELGRLLIQIIKDNWEKRLDHE
jgi:hypothetical protein